MRAQALLLACLSGLAGQTAPTPPKDARRAFEQANAALKDKRTNEATRGYQQAVALFPQYSDAWLALGRLQFQLRQIDAARTALQAAIRADPKASAAYLILAELEQDEKHWKQVEEITDGQLRVDAVDYPQAWLMNAIAHYNQHDPQAAEKSAREAERLDARRRFPDAWRLLGAILAGRGDFAGAADQYREYLRLAPTSPDAENVRARLADAVKRAGDSPAPDPNAFRSNTTLAVVRFQVHQNKGHAIRAIDAADIEVREDGVAQKIALFEGGTETARTVPLEISLLFDCSSSVEHISAWNGAVFRQTVLDEFPNASLAIYGFSQDLVRFTRPTRDPAALKNAVDRVATIPQRDTPLFGSIADTIRDAASTGANVVRMLVVFSDGESESLGDEERAAEATRAATESGTTVFPVLLNRAGASSPESANSVADFIRLAAATGGRALNSMMGADVLPMMLKSLADEIRSDYVAGFYVPVSDKPATHQIDVVLRSKDRGQVVGHRILVH